MAVVVCEIAIFEPHGSRDELIERYAERVQVGAVVDFAAGSLGRRPRSPGWKPTLESDEAVQAYPRFIGYLGPAM